MHLKSLELTGFKSFVQTRIDLPTGITAVVGPNGVGKTNVVDAILWVLGEQSTKTLRGERMEDVIFNGTETQKPLGMAEVSLIMSGISDGKLEGIPALPHGLGDCHEVMITRRLFRNGDSEYLINKTPCRLKDIRSLFLDTRAGTKGHTIIEQGRLEQILNASPQDRRELIEETAGIVRYKKQKAEALRKLESTQQNLLRVRDIIAEVRRQLGSLERQARQARTYQTLLNEARTLELRLLVGEYRRLMETQAKVEAELAALESVEAGKLAEQARLNRDLEAVKLSLVSGEQLMSKLRDDLASVEHQQGQALTVTEVERERVKLYEQQRVQAVEALARLRAESEQAKTSGAELQASLAQSETTMAEQATAVSALEQQAQSLMARRAAAIEEVEQVRRRILDLTVQVAAGQNALASLDSQRQEALRRAERLAAERAELESQRTATAEQLQEVARSRESIQARLRDLQRTRESAVLEQQGLDDGLHELTRLLGQQQQELAGTESRARALKGILREEMGYGQEGAEDSTSLRQACASVRAAIAEGLDVPPALVAAIEAVLGERLRAWLVNGPPEACQAIQFLTEKGLGRGAFVPQRPRWAGSSKRRGPDWWAALKDHPGVLGRAVDLVRVSAEWQEAFAWLLADVVLVESVDVALQLWERGRWTAPEGPTLVTRDGVSLDPAGVMTGGRLGTSGGLLQRRRESQQLEARQAELIQALETTRRLIEQQSARQEAMKESLRQLDADIREAEMQELALVKDAERLAQKLEERGRGVEVIGSEEAAEKEARSRCETELVSGGERLTRVRQEKEREESVLSTVTAALQKTEQESVALQEELGQARLTLTALRERRERYETDLARLRSEMEERTLSIQALERQISSLETDSRRSQVERDRNEALFKELEQQALRLKADLGSAQDAQTRNLETVRGLERQLAVVREALGSGRETRTAVAVHLAEINTRKTALEDTLASTYQLSVEAALAEMSGHEPAHAEADGVLSEEAALELKEQLQKLRERLQRLGPINLAAIEEHRELDERYRFLTSQDVDLSNSINSLKEIIHRINRTTEEMFLQTFQELQGKFGEMFARFFSGGRAELVLTEAEEPLELHNGSRPEPGVDIVVQPPGKRLKNITMLSGGEKTLTAMALLFASFLIRPTPFCILDEIDAPLDEENIGRFTGVLRELAEQSQFVVITHNKRSMEVADSLFGVTMEEPGISKLISVRLTDLQPAVLS